MNKLEIIKTTKKIAETFNYVVDIPISINNHLSTTLGRVVFKKVGSKYYPTKIEYSPNIVNLEDSMAIDVIKHELAHYMVLVDTKQNHQHDQVWKHYATVLGTSTKATYKLEHSLSKEDYKYEVVCSRCGKTIGKYKRSGTVVKHPSRYKSNCCKANIKINRI